VSTTNVGIAAETAVASHLVAYGYQILVRNWKTRWCEIDIVACKEQVVYFVEVKYRQSSDWGDGLDSITSRKLLSMQRAAQFWLARKNIGHECSLAAVAVSGKNYTIGEMVLI